MEGLLILIGIWVLDVVIKKVAANRKKQQQQPPLYQPEDDDSDDGYVRYDYFGAPAGRLFSDISNMRAGLAFRRDAKEYVVVMLTNGIYRGVLHIQHKDGKITGLRMEDSLEGVGPVEDLIHVNEK